MAMNAHTRVRGRARFEHREWALQTARFGNELAHRISTAHRTGPRANVARLCSCRLHRGARVAVTSTVENIGNVGGVFGRAVSTTWELLDGSEGLRATGTAQIADGQAETWEGSSGPAEADDGDWVLRITLDTDDENVDVTSIIDVLHAEAESPPQPFTSDQSEVDAI